MSLTELSRHPAVVTGAASGIGAALTTALLARGFTVLAVDRDAEALRRVGDTPGVETVVADVADPAAMRDVAARAPDARLVCLNAGIVGTATGAPWEVPADDWDRVFSVNVGGVVNGLRAFVPGLLAAGEPAHIAVTASLAGLAVFPGGGAYGPSKHAVVALATHAALVLADTPVGVSMSCPALVASGMSDQGTPAADVAERALRAIDDGTFAVVDPEWTESITRQRTAMAAGHLPDPPAPTR